MKGNNVAELSRVPRTTGLPQIDLIRRRKRPTAFGIRPRRRKRIRRRPVRRWTRPRRVSRYPVSSLRRRRLR
ncbi:hypothetical protein [uncultured Aquimarina sp.]|uniref:hypothetical protein n=1 Tax=uncultured Aquimarina sp. TaxID=575652 RepID=UPI0034202A2A